MSFFGADRITVLSRAEASIPIRHPLLGVVPQAVKPVRIQGDFSVEFPVTVRIYLPVETPIARATDPETSHLAGEEITRSGARAHQQAQTVAAIREQRRVELAKGVEG